ncbi:MAG: hypothetical protein Q8L08_00010 [Candidatus Nanopelagicaceae bacterium]|nr:hypothetical protein [Candidatus Nanopelagicaceae bacterium]
MEPRKRFLILGLVALLLSTTVPYLAQAAGTDGLALAGNETLTIDSDRTITGDITLSGNSVLTIKNAIVRVTHSPDNPRSNITLNDSAKLILDNAALIPPQMNPDNLYLLALGSSHIDIHNSTFINVMNLVEHASITGIGAQINSSAPPLNIPEDAGAFGIVQLAGDATADFTDSTIGSFALFFGPGDSAKLSNLKPQHYVDFDLKRNSEQFSGSYNIILKNSNVLPVKLKGPFERSWAIFVDPASKVTIKNSSLNKLVFQQFKNETLSFKDLQLDVPQRFDFRDVHLENTTIANEWGFFGEDSNITVENSRGVWLWPIGTGNWVLKKSMMIEFDPRGFTGALHFDNSEWANAGEVFEGTAMKITGTFKTTQRLNEHLALSNSTIRREFPFTVSKKGKPVTSFSANVLDQGTSVARARGAKGAAVISLLFTPDNYKKQYVLAVKIGRTTKTMDLNLFSTTPLKIDF